MHVSVAVEFVKASRLDTLLTSALSQIHQAVFCILSTLPFSGTLGQRWPPFGRMPSLDSATCCLVPPAARSAVRTL